MKEHPFTPADLDLLVELNRLRAQGDVAAAATLEDHFARHFAAHHHLAVYGTLAPGQPNHHHLSGLAGVWHSGHTVTGELAASGWAADQGFRALRWSPAGGAVPHLFASVELPQHWPRLDAFEGPEYLRILVPLHLDGAVSTVSNLYAERPG